MSGARPSVPDPIHWMREQGMSDAEIDRSRAFLDRANAWLEHLAPFALRERSAYLRGDFAEVAHQAWHVEQHVRELGIENAKAQAIITLLLAMLADSTIMISEILAVTDDDADSAGPVTPSGPADTTEASDGR